MLGQVCLCETRWTKVEIPKIQNCEFSTLLLVRTDSDPAGMGIQAGLTARLMYRCVCVCVLQTGAHAS